MKRRQYSLWLALFATLLLVGAPICLFSARMAQAARNRRLIAAIKHNDTSEVLDLLAYSADANTREPDPTQSPLWHRFLDWLSGKPLAAQKGRSALEVALNTHLVNYGDPHPLTDATILKALINHGANVNLRYQDEYGNECTPLIQVIWLLAFGTRGSETTQYMELASLLLKKGANPNGSSHPDATPLSNACCGDVELVRELLDYGADIHQRDGFDHTPLETAIDQDDGPVIAFLLDRNADARPASHDGDQDPILRAAEFGNAASVQALLAHGADVNTQNSDGRTALIYTANDSPDVRFEAQCCKTARLLLAHGAKIDLRNSDGSTALFLAVQYSHLELVALLLNKGAKVNIRNRYGKTALDYNRGDKAVEIAKLLRQHRAKE
ncbi:MAG: arp [Chthonomonadaceae bacterium]|nr:arp [Chthonomonadaceae bacterium]